MIFCRRFIFCVDGAPHSLTDPLLSLSLQKPLTAPTGIDMGKGPFDAYDVLPPKKWKNSDKE